MASGVVVGAAVHAHDRAMIGPLAILLIMSVERNQSSPQVECSAPVLCRGLRSLWGVGSEPEYNPAGGLAAGLGAGGGMARAGRVGGEGGAWPRVLTAY